MEGRMPLSQAWLSARVFLGPQDLRGAYEDEMR